MADSVSDSVGVAHERTQPAVEGDFVTGFATGLYPAEEVTELRALLSHGLHGGCCITPGFEKVVEAASAAVLVVDAEGFIIYANPETLGMLGYSLQELTSRHIFQIVEADAAWVASEFSYLASNQLWNGNVLLRRLPGDLLRVSVNAFSSTTPDAAAEHIAFLHSSCDDGPAIARLPDVALQAGLTVRQIALLEMLSEGLADKEIAAVLCAPLALVNKEIEALLDELGARSRTEACIAAIQEGIIA